MLPHKRRVERERSRYPQARRLLRAALQQVNQTSDDVTVAGIKRRLA